MTEEPKVEKKAKAPAEPKFGRIREGLTQEQILAVRKRLTVDAVPEGYVKMSEVGVAVRKANIPVSKLVRATGGDRGINSPADPVFQITFVGRTRYLAPEVLTKGMQLLQNPEFLKTRRARKPKAEGEAGRESGPVKGAKGNPTVVRPAAK